MLKTNNRHCSFRRFLRGLKGFLGLILLILEIAKRLSELLN